MAIEIQNETQKIIDRSLMRAHISQLMEERKYEEAEAELLDYAKKYEADDFYYIQYIDCELGAKSFAAARELFNEAIEHGIDPLMLKAQAFRLMIFDGQYAEALALVEQIEQEKRISLPDVFDEENEDFSSLIIRGSLMALLDDYQGAIQLLEDSLLENYDQAGAVILSLCYILMNQTDRGFELYEEALAQDDDLRAVIATLLPDLRSFNPDNHVHIEDHAKELLENFVRFAFDVYEEQEQPGMLEQAREMIEENPEEFLNVLRFFARNNGPSPYLYLLERLCHEIMDNEAGKRAANRRILVFEPSADPLENESWLPLQLSALSQLSYKKPTIQKHLERLYQVNSGSVSAIRLLVQSAYSYGLIVLGNGFILNLDPERFEGKERAEALQMKAACFFDNADYLEAYRLLNRYRDELSLSLMQMYAELCVSLDRYEELKKAARKWMPEPVIASHLMRLMIEHEDLEDFVRLNTYMLSDSVRNRITDAQNYFLYEARFSPSGIVCADNFRQSLYDGAFPYDFYDGFLDFLESFVPEMMDAQMEQPGDPENPGPFRRPFMISDSDSWRTSEYAFPFAVKKSEVFVEDFLRDEIPLTLKAGPDEYAVFGDELDLHMFADAVEEVGAEFSFDDEDEEDEEDLKSGILYGSAGQSLSEFRKFIRKHPDSEQLEELLSNLDGQMEEQIDSIFDKFVIGSEEDMQIYDEIDEFIVSLNLPQALLESLPIVLTDPRFIDQTMELPGFEGIDETELDLIMGMILMYLGSEGIEFPSGYEDLEEIIFSDYYLSLYDAAAEILRTIMLHIHRAHAQRDRNQKEKPQEDESPARNLNQFTDPDADSEDGALPGQKTEPRGEKSDRFHLPDLAKDASENFEDEDEDGFGEDDFYISTDGMLN